MLEFKNEIGSLVKAIAGSAKFMAKSADQVGSAAFELKSAVESFKTQFTDVLNNVSVDLGQAIMDMSAQASKTLLEGTSTLGAATDKISLALGTLSQDIEGTMTSVETSVNCKRSANPPLRVGRRSG